MIECQIGWLAEHVDGTYSGTIRTLTIRDQIALRPAAGETRGSVARYDVLIGSGAVMGRAAAEADGIAVELRSPELATPIVARLVAAAEPGEWLLMWRSAP